MNKEKVTKSIFTKRNQDYTFIALFLFIFSVFIFFAIRPSLKTAFSLKKEEKDLIVVDNAYEEKIMSIASIQSQIEESRDDLYLIDEAISEFPEVNKMVNDIKSIADKNTITIKKANIADVNLTKNIKKLDKVIMIIEARAKFDNLQGFIKDLFNQRRLKAINNLKISEEKESTASGELNVILTIDGFYL